MGVAQLEDDVGDGGSSAGVCSEIVGDGVVDADSTTGWLLLSVGTVDTVGVVGSTVGGECVGEEDGMSVGFAC